MRGYERQEEGVVRMTNLLETAEQERSNYGMKSSDEVIVPLPGALHHVGQRLREPIAELLSTADTEGGRGGGGSGKRGGNMLLEHSHCNGSRFRAFRTSSVNIFCKRWNILLLVKFSLYRCQKTKNEYFRSMFTVYRDIL